MIEVRRNGYLRTDESLTASSARESTASLKHTEVVTFKKILDMWPIYDIEVEEPTNSSLEKIDGGN